MVCQPAGTAQTNRLKSGRGGGLHDHQPEIKDKAHKGTLTAREGTNLRDFGYHREWEGIGHSGGGRESVKHTEREGRRRGETTN